MASLVLAGQFVDQGRFAHIGFTHHRDPRDLFRLLRCLPLGEMGHQRIQHISQSQPGGRRDGDWLSDSQIIEFIDFRHIFVKAVHLVDHKEHRLPGTPQHIRHLGIRVHQSLAHIRHKDDHIRRIYGNLRLLPHLREDDIPGIRLDSAGIYYGKIVIQPGDIGINPVSGNTGRILHNGNPLTRQGVKKRRFSHIRSAHDGHHWFAHSYLHLTFQFSIQSTKSCPLDFTISTCTCKDFFSSVRVTSSRKTSSPQRSIFWGRSSRSPRTFP